MVKKAELSIEIRAAIVGKHKSGISVRQICQELQLSKQTVHYQINKDKQMGSIKN